MFISSVIPVCFYFMYFGTLLVCVRRFPPKCSSGKCFLHKNELNLEICGMPPHSIMQNGSKWLIVWGIGNMADSWFFTRNDGGKKIVWNAARNKQKSPRILYPTKLFFENKDEIKTFPDKQKLRDFIVSKLALQKNIKVINLKENDTDSSLNPQEEMKSLWKSKYKRNNR